MAISSPARHISDGKIIFSIKLNSQEFMPPIA
jgi:hypothetical protein